MRAFGASQAQIDAWLATRPPGESDVFQVHPWNVLTVRLMMAMQTQWLAQSLSTMSKAVLVKTGLNYTALEGVARLSGLGEILPADFARIQHFEATALAAWAEARA
jgi:hypothetical protein